MVLFRSHTLKEPSSILRAASHLVPNPFDPRTYGPPLPVPRDKWSQKIQSPWTNGPQPIWFPWTNGPISNLVPMDKWSPKIWSPWTNGPQPIWSPYFQIITACHPGQIEYSYIFGDHLSRGTKFDGERLSRGINFMGIICPGGQEVKDWESNGFGT